MKTQDGKVTFILLTLAVMLAGACVPPTKFKSLQATSQSCQLELQKMKAENERLNVSLKEATTRLASLENKLNQIGDDTLRWKNELNTLRENYNQLNRDYADLNEANQAFIRGSEGEIKRLMENLQSAQKEMQVRENELNRLSGDLASRQKQLETMQQELNQRNMRLSELEKVLEDQQSLLASLRRKVSDALLGFEGQGLSVTQKNGKVYVSLEEKLLFPSGSTQVDPKGVTALKSLSTVLEQNPDISIMIEGHTDDVPVIAGSVYKDNWDLSVLRATSIARILLAGSKIEPVRITCSGRSQYQPVDAAKTAEARQKNRRTEIILSPKLDELYQLIESN